MSDLRSLYQEMIVDHGRSPRNFGKLPEATYCQEGHNPLCGDKLILYVAEHKGLIQALRFEGVGCAISIASTSLMTEILEGKTWEEAEKIFNDFHLLVTENQQTAALESNLGKLMAFKNISEFPARVKCATLAWHTFMAAVGGGVAQVSTE
jgi:nitrogen fixation NifU-like protein